MPFGEPGPHATRAQSVRTWPEVTVTDSGDREPWSIWSISSWIREQGPNLQVVIISPVPCPLPDPWEATPHQGGACPMTPVQNPQAQGLEAQPLCQMTEPMATLSWACEVVTSRAWEKVTSGDGIWVGKSLWDSSKSHKAKHSRWPQPCLSYNVLSVRAQPLWLGTTCSGIGRICNHLSFTGSSTVLVTAKIPIRHLFSSGCDYHFPPN